MYAVNSMINLRHYMEVGVQPHAPAALPLGKEPTVPTEYNESVHFGQNKKCVSVTMRSHVTQLAI